MKRLLFILSIGVMLSCSSNEKGDVFKEGTRGNVTDTNAVNIDRYKSDSLNKTDSLSFHPNLPD